MRIWNSHSVKKCNKGTLWDFSNIHSVAKYQKVEGVLFGDFEKFSQKKSHKAEITSTKKCEARTQTLKFLINLVAVEVTSLMWQ